MENPVARQSLRERVKYHLAKKDAGKDFVQFNPETMLQIADQFDKFFQEVAGIEEETERATSKWRDWFWDSGNPKISSLYKSWVDIS